LTVFHFYIYEYLKTV